MRLNHFVIKDGDHLVNLTTRNALPLNASVSELQRGFFLEGQERDAVDDRLFGRPPTSFAINLIPTWECNLRCNHCFVLHELVRRDPGAVDPDMLAGFVGRLIESYPSISSGQIHFVGGEPTLRSNENMEIIRSVRDAAEGVKIIFTATSNGFECGEDALKFLLALDKITISVDGPKRWHDSQRRPLERKGVSPFDSSVATIKALVAMGARDRLIVQASLPQDGMEIDKVTEMYKSLLMAGVKYEYITPGFVAPNRQNPVPDEDFLKVNVRSAHVRPCCKYRFMSNFVVDTSNRVFCDYFDANSDNMLGHLSDPIGRIAESHERVIRATMPVLNDSKCADCPVIGLCWGWCANTKCLKPSDYCDPDTLLKRARQNAEKENLRNFLKNTKKNDLSDEGAPKKRRCGGESCSQA